MQRASGEIVKCASPASHAGMDWCGQAWYRVDWCSRRGPPQAASEAVGLLHPMPEVSEWGERRMGERGARGVGGCGGGLSVVGN